MAHSLGLGSVTSIVPVTSRIFLATEIGLDQSALERLTWTQSPLPSLLATTGTWSRNSLGSECTTVRLHIPGNHSVPRSSRPLAAWAFCFFVFSTFSSASASVLAIFVAPAARAFMPHRNWPIQMLFSSFSSSGGLHCILFKARMTISTFCCSAGSCGSRIRITSDEIHETIDV